MILPPNSINALLTRAYALAGMSITQIGQQYQQILPPHFLQNKGWVGQLLESVLGAQAGSEAKPDFPLLGVELKTIPVNTNGQPLESTYVSVVPLGHLTDLQWQDSVVWQKLRRILWIPIIGERDHPPGQRIIGNPLLWEPSLHQAQILQNDWEEHMEKISLGLLDQLKSTDGVYLQVRPKAANSKVLCPVFDNDGAVTQTLPRGFYLRTKFTKEIITSSYII
jgi:DNA mismatch repair protein MutH